MKLLYDNDHLSKRDRTDLLAEEGKLRYWGIYDFAFKHRTRIFDENDIEVAYVEKDISLDEDVVELRNPDDSLIDRLAKRDDSYLLENKGWKYSGSFEEGKIEDIMKIEKGVLEFEKEEDILNCVMILFSLVEIIRQE